MVVRLFEDFVLTAFVFVSHFLVPRLSQTQSTSFRALDYRRCTFLHFKLCPLPTKIPTAMRHTFARHRRTRGGELSKKSGQRWRPLLRVPRASRPRESPARNDRDGHENVTPSASCCQGRPLNNDRVAWQRWSRSHSRAPQSIRLFENPAQLGGAGKAVLTLSRFRTKASPKKCCVVTSRIRQHVTKPVQGYNIGKSVYVNVHSLILHI